MSTSTYDGLALAFAIVEFIHDRIQAKTLFATHYHQLADLEAYLPRVKNFNVLVHEGENEIQFLHRIAPGATDKSFGIHVARIAGVPFPVIERAQAILHDLENQALKIEKKMQATRRQLTLTEIFSSGSREYPISSRLARPGISREQLRKTSPRTVIPAKIRAALKEILELDVNTMTPVQALVLLNTIQERLKDLKSLMEEEDSRKQEN